MFSFDSYGWLADSIIEGRVTSAEPPAHSAKEVGQPYPNWTGKAWTMDMNYSEPPAPPDPADVPVVSTTGPITKLEFLSLFVDDEIGDILELAKVNKQLATFIKKLELAGDVNLSDKRTINAINALEAATLLSVDRAARILAGKAPL